MLFRSLSAATTKILSPTDTNFTSLGSYSISDTAATVATNISAGVITGASSVTASGATVDQAVTLDGSAHASLSYSLADSGNNYDALTVAQAKAVYAASNTPNNYSVSDTADAVYAAKDEAWLDSNGSGTVTASGATVSQALAFSTDATVDYYSLAATGNNYEDRKSTRLNSSHSQQSRMPSSA